MNPEDRLSTSLMLAAVAVLIAALVTAVCIAAWPDPGRSRVRSPAAFTPPVPDATEPLENFCLLLLEPRQVDHLELRGEPQNRTIYKFNENQEWYLQEVNP